jgi:hypothetical protein
LTPRRPAASAVVREADIGSLVRRNDLIKINIDQ